MSAIRLSAVALLCALASTAVSAAPASATSRPIVYLIVVDGLDGDRYDAGNMPFLKSLGGTYYKESRSIMVAETNPNHTAMITGAYGNRSGIPGNEFALYAPLENGDSCKATGPQDISKAPTVTSGENHNCVLAQTLFAAAKRQVPGRYVTAFATGKPKLGRLFSGRTVDPAKTDADVIFSPCGSDATEEDEAYCSKVPLNPISGYALDDGTVMDAVLAQMYQGPNATRPDFSFVNLHQVDSAGHATGTGAAYEQTVRDADAQIKRLVDTLKARKEWDRTVMIVVSDHSMDTTLTKVTLTSRLESAGVPSDAFTVVENGSVDMIYLHDRTSPDRFALLAKMRAVVLAGSGVEEALYREDNPADGGAAHTVATVHPAWHVDGERHGDLFVTSKPGTSFSDPSGFSNPIPGNHGGPQTRDNLFVVTGGSPAVKDQEVGGTAAPFFDDTLINEGSAENVDSATTVAGLLGLDPPAQNDGRFLSEAFD
uniref:alkaline phosphatase family protein n=1 Tax=Paraconexibacter sp. TaxID=2949640 RepID=UPI0035689848